MLKSQIDEETKSTQRVCLFCEFLELPRQVNELEKVVRLIADCNLCVRYELNFMRKKTSRSRRKAASREEVVGGTKRR